eukprot:CAMPEP_0195143116 /NCGR_PEP_ID=MMETSP0448-20130528/165816_1 /TAXON_ID=66468 /ORGANISM="Heterocapsa triquestra, Strain CCMP 448" /LENGTH=524 /DNA_ID=CAMNT_0040181535 /DNA_START=26 /DNA_END=1597 /DNA_ORIENTATION=-
MAGKALQRAAPMAHKFKVQMYDFSCEGLAVSNERCDAYLKIDFDNFKIFKTDHGQGNTSPEWGFKAGFHYIINYLEKLGRQELTVQCSNRASGQLIGEASIDLQTIACGPPHFKLTLRDQSTGEPRGVLKFTCVMKMLSPNLNVVCQDLSLTMQGCPAPARLQISSSIDEANRIVDVPHSDHGVWDSPFSLAFETALADMLKAPGSECLRFAVIDEMGLSQGEALVEFRKAFSAKPDMPISFKVPVTYTCTMAGEEKPETVGAVGELVGTLLYQNVPVYAQMVGGLCVDGQVEGGNWLFEGLPYPHCLSQPPPLWQDPADRPGFECMEDPADRHGPGLDDIDDKVFLEALEQIDLPLPWEKRRERATDRGFRTYFADPRSRKTTWKDPRFLPEHWDQRIDSQTGKVYFAYQKTRQTTFVDPRGCPVGWDMRLSKNGDLYFAFLPSMKTTFLDPRGLPDHIDPALDDLGRMYFKNHEMKTTTWEDPRDSQQEVTLTQWRQGRMTRWWREQVLREVEERESKKAEL